MSLVFNPFTGNFDEVSDLTVDVGSTPNANASTTTQSGTSLTLTLQPADTTNPGILTASTQTIGGVKTFASAINMDSNQINALLDPTLAQDAATKSYVDASIAALNPAASVFAATPGTNIAGTYLNGVAGVGATFTTTATGVLTIDGVTPPLHARVLIKDQTSGFQNGIYTITTLGAVAVPTIFTRALDYNTAADMNSAGLIPVLNGTLNALSSWQQVASITTVGTDALVFVEFTANPSLYLLKANNLSDVASKTASFDNLSPLTMAGDILFENSTPSNTRLPIGSTGQILTVVSGLPTWQAPVINAITALTGDGTATGPGSVAFTLATVNSNVGSFTNANITVNAKGLITSASNGTNGTVTSVAATVPAFLSIAGSPITSSGTLAFTLSGTALPVTSGGTGQTSLTAHDVLVGNGTSGITQISPSTAGFVLTSNGVGVDPSFQLSIPGGAIVPTVQRLLSGTGSYTTPSGVIYINVRMVGGGGAGGVSTASGANGSATTFGTSLLVANGGGGAAIVGVSGGGAGGTASLGTGPVGIAAQGASGTPGPPTVSPIGGTGGSTYFGGGGVGAGANGSSAQSGISAAANSGAGGGGGNNGTNSVNFAGGGGGAGGYIDAIITAPLSTYAFTIGAGGIGSAASGANGAGGNGGSGVIEVTEYYANGAIGTATNVTGIVAVANGGTGLATGISAKYQITSGQAITTGGTQIIANNKLFDTTNSYNTTTGFFICPAIGKYEVKAYINPGTPVSSTSSFLNVGLNGTAGDTSELYTTYGNGAVMPRIGGSTIVQCTAIGQTIGMVGVVFANNTINTTNSYISFNWIGP